MIDFGERKRENRTTHAGEEGRTNIREEQAESEEDRFWREKKRDYLDRHNLRFVLEKDL